MKGLLITLPSIGPNCGHSYCVYLIPTALAIRRPNIGISDIVAAHGALAAALLDPVFNASGVVVMTAWAFEFCDHVIVAKGSHTYDTLIFLAYCTEKLL